MILECECGRGQSICPACCMKKDAKKALCILCCPTYDEHWELRFGSKSPSASRKKGK